MAGTTINKNFIEWPVTSKIFLINRDGSSFQMLKYISSTKKKEFYKIISKMTKWSPWEFYEWYKELMSQCYEYRIWILLYHMFDPKCTEPRGFVCRDIYSSHLPSFFEDKLQYWSTHLFTGVKGEGILSPLGQKILTQVHGDGYLALKELSQLFHPYLVNNPTSIMPSHPIQRGLYSTYHAKTMFFYDLQG